MPRFAAMLFDGAPCCRHVIAAAAAARHADVAADAYDAIQA